MKTRCFRPAFAGFACLLTILSAVTVRAGESPRPSVRPGPMDAEMASRLGHLTLDDAIDIGLHRNPAILNQLQEIQRNFGIVIQARAAALPQLVASGNFTQTDKNLIQSGGSSSSGSLAAAGIPPDAGFKLVDKTGKDLLSIAGQPQVVPFSGLLGGDFTSPNKSYTVTLEIQQTLYNASILPGIRSAKFLRDAAYYTLRETVDTTVNTVKTDFYTVLVDRANIDNQNESLRLLQSQLNDQQNRFNAGTVPRFDVLQASVAVSNQRPNVITAENKYKLDFIVLARTLGIEYGPIQERDTPLHLIGNLDYHPQTFSPDAGVAAGKANRAILKQQRLAILSDIENIRGQAAGYQPVIVGMVGLEARSNSVNDDLGNPLTGWFFGGQFNWNIFDGLATYGRVKQYKALLREARITYEDTVNGVVEEIQNNYLTIQQSKELVASQVLNVSEAEEAVRLSQARLSAGAGTQLDVLNSQTQLLQAQNTELQARYNYAVALGNYERVTGTSTVYDEAFRDPLTTASRPNGVDSTGAAGQGKPLPLGTIKTPDVQERGSGRPLPTKIDASKNDAKPRKSTTEVKSRKSIGDREYLFDSH